MLIVFHYSHKIYEPVLYYIQGFNHIPMMDGNYETDDFISSKFRMLLSCIS